MRAGRPPISSSNASSTERRGKQKSGQRVPKSEVSNAGRHDPDGKVNHHHGSESVTRSHSMSLGDGNGEIDTGHRYASADELANTPLVPLSMHHPLPFSTYPGSAGVGLAWDDGGMPTFYDGEDLVDLEMFGSDFNWSFPQAPTLSNDTHSSATSSPPGRDHRSLNAGLGQNRKLPNELQIPELARQVGGGGGVGGATAVFDPASRNVDSQVGIAEDNREMVEESIDVSMGDRDESGYGGRLSSEDTSSMPSDNEAQHRRMQQISELTMSLYSLITTDDQRQHSHSATNTTSSSLTNDLQDQFVGDIVKYSTAFLKILKSFHPSTSSSLLTRPLTECSTLGSSNSDGSASESASVLSDFAGTSRAHKKRSRQDSSLWRHRSVASRSNFSSSNSNESPPRPISADMTTVFQILTCYIRIIHLHSILYARILDHLLTSLPSHSHNNNRNKIGASQQLQQQQQPPPPLFPGMQVGGVSLDDFSVFQVKLILQISTHVLGEIEMALGLPDGFRISRKTPGTTGVLETSVSVQFIEATMREIEMTMLATKGSGNGNGRDPEMGLGVEKDRVNSIRENLVRLRQLLKGTINI